MNDGNSNGQEHWFQSTGYFESELQKRLAHQIGTAIIQGHMAEIRAGMEAGRADHFGSRVADIEALVTTLQAQVAAQQPTEAELQRREDLEADNAAEFGRGPRSRPRPRR